MQLMSTFADQTKVFSDEHTDKNITPNNLFIL